MTEKIQIVQRAAPELSTPDDDFYSWTEVIARRSKMGPIKWLRLLFKPWLTVCAPPGTPCEAKNMYGQPLYQYKIIDNQTYLLRPYPSPSFPGS